MSDGIILIDKPAGMTSFGVVARIRRVLSESKGKGAARAGGFPDARSDEEKPSVVPHKRQRVKVGHTGTLDPFATGLMIIVTGNECKNAQNYSKLDKVYEATIVLGQTSTTGDPEGEIAEYGGEEDGRWKMEDGDLPNSNSQIPIAKTLEHPTVDSVQTILQSFTGEIEQTPPIYSAIKINGQRAYKLARRGEEVEMPSRKVTIYSLELLSYDYPELNIRTHVSSGTYIRTLAEDIGKVLGVGAYCHELRRTKIADWSVDDAKNLSDFGIND